MQISGAAARAASTAARHTGRGIPGAVGLVAAGVGALVVGAFAYAGYKLIQGATSGFDVGTIQRNTFSQLDHSHNGLIELDASLPQQEFVHFDSHSDNNSDSMLDDYWTVEDESAKLVAADTDHDATVTSDEFQEFLRSYDTNGNGKLNFSESGKLERDHRTVELQRTDARPTFDYPYVPTTPLPSSSGDD